MRKTITQITIVTVLSTSVFAEILYIVKPKDTLSHIIQQYYSGERIYGAKGKLREIIHLNPAIHDSNKIYPRQKIILATTPLIYETAELVPEKAASSQKSLRKSTFSALYGAKFLNVKQSCSFGRADTRSLFLNYIKINSEFYFDNWSLSFQADSYRFRDTSLQLKESEQMYSFNLAASYKWMLAGVELKQIPLFRKMNGNIELAKMNVMNLALGVKKDIELSTESPTMLSMRGLIGYPIASLEDGTRRYDSVSGISLSAQVELTRQFYTSPSYTLHASWITDVGFKKISQKVDWGISSGNVTSHLTEASTALGMMLRF